MSAVGFAMAQFWPRELTGSPGNIVMGLMSDGMSVRDPGPGPQPGGAGRLPTMSPARPVLSNLEQALSAPKSVLGAALGETKPVIDLTAAQSLDAENGRLAGSKERRVAREAGTDALDDSVTKPT
ncbi:hypothetical protein [Aliiruegeria sabulilitoris]|uniref:hypothetical protein n=1 Tax=Aliiruegeria sabulilitoris TaxID=1510458 RepID=UPI00082EE23C|nr:hypothetical protein [Aliiruegeria sabulilitoris]NDR55077.1 hypothetical protein [Pseudoruegeria sp. M32A2M]